MEFSISGDKLKTFVRSIIGLANVGDELVVQASPSQLALHTSNASGSAHQCITFQPNFFDAYNVSNPQAELLLLKDVCSVLDTHLPSVARMEVQLFEYDASIVKWKLEWSEGKRNIRWIPCIDPPDIKHLSLDRSRFSSSLVVHPQNLSKLLGKFQSSLQEITMIATDETSIPSDPASELGRKAVEFRSYVDQNKGGDSMLPTQLWVDPSEEFLHYTHAGDPVSITFSLKELKAFLSFCEECEANIHLFFKKAGEPILIAPNFGLDDGSNSSFDATLVLGTMLVSQLQERFMGTSGIGAGKKQNRKTQAKEQATALKKAEVEAQLSKNIPEKTFRELLGIADSIIEDWSSKEGLIISHVVDQKNRDICWAIVLARLVQALNNIGLARSEHLELSYEDLIDQIKPKTKSKNNEGLTSSALYNMNTAFKHILQYGVLKLSGKKHQKAESKGKRVQKDLTLYKDVQAFQIRTRLNRYPVGLILILDNEFDEYKGEKFYYVPKKTPLSKDSRPHSILLIGYGETETGDTYFLGQNSHGTKWGCQGYGKLIIEGKVDIICQKEEI